MRTLDTRGVHTFEAPQRFYGLEVGARMTVLELSDGLLVHSPLAIDPERLVPFGNPCWVVAPNKLHHLHVGPWVDAGLSAFAPAGLVDKRPDVSFAGVLDGSGHPFGSEVEVVPLACFGFTEEVVLLHRPSRTLVVTDLVFHFSTDAPWLTRAAMACLLGYPGCRTTLLERVGFDRKVARREIRHLLDLDFDRLVMAHGEVIEAGGKDALAGAFGWLL